MTTFNLLWCVPERPRRVEVGLQEKADHYRRWGYTTIAEQFEFAIEHGFVHYDEMTREEKESIRDPLGTIAMPRSARAYVIRVDFANDAVAVQFALTYNQQAIVNT